MFFTLKTLLNQHSNQNQNVLTTDITTDFNTDMYYFSIITSKSFFIYTKFHAKKRIARILRIPTISTMYKIMHINFTRKQERTL